MRPTRSIPSPAGHLKPVGDWNQPASSRTGTHVEHWLNGVKLVEYELGSPDWEAKVKASKFKDWPNYGRAKRGPHRAAGRPRGLARLPQHPDPRDPLNPTGTTKARRTRREHEEELGSSSCGFVASCLRGSAVQNIILNPKRIDRSLPAIVLVICPNVAPRNVPFGLLKCGVFVMLKMSTRNSPLTVRRTRTASRSSRRG